MNLHFPTKQMGANHHLKYDDILMVENLVQIKTGTNVFLITVCAIIKYCNRSYLLFCLKTLFIIFTDEKRKSHTESIINIYLF
jgi:hypothetical protein